MGSTRRHSRHPSAASSSGLRGGHSGQHTRTLRKAGNVIGHLQRELDARLGHIEILKRAVRQCAAANTDAANQLDTLVRRAKEKERATASNKPDAQCGTKLRKVSIKLMKTDKENGDLRGALRSTRNELGEARDAVQRADMDVTELREQLKRTGAARAYAVLEPIAEKTAEVGGLIGRVETAITAYQANVADVNWQQWQPQRGALGRALEPLYEALGEDFEADSTTPVSGSPAAIRAVVQAVVEKYTERIDPRGAVDLSRHLEDLRQQLKQLSDSVVASIRAVAPSRGEARAGGGGRQRRRHGSGRGSGRGNRTFRGGRAPRPQHRTRRA